MRLTSPTVQRLLNASERTLVEAAGAAALKEHTPSRLRTKVDRARGLKDKYTSLARERGRAGRGKTKPRAGTSRTDDETMKTKAEVFAAVLERFEKQLAKLDKAADKAAGKTAGKETPNAASRKTQPARAKKTAPRSASTATGKTRAAAPSGKKTTSRSRRASAPTVEQRRAAAEKLPKDELKAQARSLVEKVRRRVARATGAPEPAFVEPLPEVPELAAQPGANASPESEAQRMEARSANARSSAKEYQLDKSHLTRMHGHVAGRGQRAQARRDSKSG